MNIVSKLNYDQEELELLDFIENANPSSVHNVTHEIDNLQSAVKAKVSKRKSINLRLLENDLEKIKTEAIKVGMPYQTLIGSIIHQYVNGNFAKGH
jgi:predicted DNA binding CopG/RHH family protein